MYCMIRSHVALRCQSCPTARGINMKRQARPIANPLVLLREEFDDWAILFDPDSGHGFGPNPTGVYVWKLLDGSRSIDDLCNMLREMAKHVPADVGDHISSFVDALAAEGLVAFDSERSPNQETAGGTETGLCSPSGCNPGDRGQVNFMYEPPQLVCFTQQRAGHGICAGGSGDSQGCNINGSFPGIADCYNTGSGVGPTCYLTGHTAHGGYHCNAGYTTHDCIGGTLPEDYYCTGG